MTRAEKAAARLLETQAKGRLPIDVAAIAVQLGVALVEEPMEMDMSGLLYRNGNTTVLGVNSKHAHVRRRFTIAHELGHLMLHRGRTITVDIPGRVSLRDGRSSLATVREEIEANGFAAELLMPSDVATAEFEAWKDQGMKERGEDPAPSLSRRFDVSEQAMRFRLSNLGLVDLDESEE